MTTINFCSKKIFIRKIILKETEDFYIFEGEYNISRSKSYIIIKKLKFNKDNYKELYSQKLEDILKFSVQLIIIKNTFIILIKVIALNLSFNIKLKIVFINDIIVIKMNYFLQTKKVN